VLRTFESLETGGDLLLGFQRSDISFGLIVREWYIFNKGKSKPFMLMVTAD
jgi:hypothetical protein